jgi:hypothetical protein
MILVGMAGSDQYLRSKMRSKISYAKTKDHHSFIDSCLLIGYHHPQSSWTTEGDLDQSSRADGVLLFLAEHTKWIDDALRIVLFVQAFVNPRKAYKRDMPKLKKASWVHVVQGGVDWGDMGLPSSVKSCLGRLREQL